VDELKATLHPTPENQHLLAEHKQYFELSPVDQKMAFLEMKPNAKYNYKYQKLEQVRAHPGGPQVNHIDGEFTTTLR